MRIEFTYDAPDIRDILKNYGADITSALFFDIETTGFTADTSSLYMIGASYYDDNIKQYTGIQWFAESKEEIKDILSDFLSFAGEFSTIIHYNGDTFDLPYIRTTAQKYNLNNTLSLLKSIDVYKEIRHFKNILGLSNVKLKTVEKYMDIKRDDEYSGGDLIKVYKAYLKDRDESKKKLLLLHNHDDIKGLTEIIPILSYPVFFNNPPKVTKITNQGSHIEFKIESRLIKPVRFTCNDVSFDLNKEYGIVYVPRYHGVLKYFYDNYKDYYYLPLEDKAIHKSVAQYVDKEYKEAAKASNCYTIEEGIFLPNPVGYISPSFKADYQDKKCYFKENANILEDYQYASEYVAKLLAGTLTPP